MKLKKIMSVVMCSAMLVMVPLEALAATDISGHWAQDAITHLMKKKVISGDPDGSFRPEDKITRAEAATMGSKYFEVKTSTKSAYSDSKTHWAAGYINGMADIGAFVGNDKKFRPDVNITRAEFASMLNEAMLSKGLITQEELDEASNESFTDIDGHWAKKAIEGMSGQGLISGDPDGTFRPEDGIIRSEAAALFAKIDENIFDITIEKVNATAAIKKETAEKKTTTEKQSTTKEEPKTEAKAAPAATGNAASEAIARKYIGKPYVYGAAGPNSFDCSGLTSFVYKQLGKTLPRSSMDQSKGGTYVAKKDIQPGDLLFFTTNGKGTVSHVGLYIGDGKMIHASSGQAKVVEQSIELNYYTSRYVTARRY